jgi:hypothetical protein
MKRPATVSQFVRFFVTTAALAACAIGCGGSGGNGTGGAGMSGGQPCTIDDVNKIFVTTTANPVKGCTVINVCHDNQGSAAGLDLTSAGWQTRLVGANPTAMKGSAMSNFSMCVGHGPYLVAGSKPAAGLIIDKLNPATPTPPCGVHMPNLGTMLSATEFACVQSYFTTLTSP